MFIYCEPSLNALTVDHSAFEGSCLPRSTFLYAVSLLPFVMVLLQVCNGAGRVCAGAFIHCHRIPAPPQYALNTRVDATQLHDELLLPLVVAARLGRLSEAREAKRLRRENSHAALGGVSTRAIAIPSAAVAAAVSASGDTLTLILVTSDSPCPAFETFARNLAEFVERRALGIPTQIVRISALSASPRRRATYVFLLDSAASVDAFYRRVHRPSPVPAGSDPAASATSWRACPIAVVCHASVLMGGGGGAVPTNVSSAPATPPTDATQGATTTTSGLAATDSLAVDVRPEVVPASSNHLSPHLRTVRSGSDCARSIFHTSTTRAGPL